MNPTKCKHHPDSFCYVCGEFMYKRDTRFKISTNIVFYDQYRIFFNREICNQDKTWVPHYICLSCKSRLKSKFNNETIFAKPNWYSLKCLPLF